MENLTVPIQTAQFLQYLVLLGCVDVEVVTLVEGDEGKGISYKPHTLDQELVDKLVYGRVDFDYLLISFDDHPLMSGTITIYKHAEQKV